jgi:chromosome segregation ATPase
MAEADTLIQAFMTVGGTISGVVAVIVAWGKAREMANKPLEDLKSSLTAQITQVKTDLSAQVTALDAKVTAVRKDVDTLNVHFDPKGGDVRGKLDSIESRLAKMDSLAANERAELKGLIADLKPILHELRERT